MSTNFQWKIPEGTLPTGAPVPVDEDHPDLHIGKRSGAGLCCWDCRVTLCREGIEAVHSGHGSWFEECPSCGAKTVPRSSLSRRSAAVDRGTALLGEERPAGVEGTCSFSWAQDPARVRAVCASRPDDAIVEDEYGTAITGAEFLRMLDCHCAVEFTDMIGRRFC